MSYTYFLQRARTRYRGKRLIVAGLIPFLIVWGLIGILIAGVSLLSGDLLLGIGGIFGAFVIAIIYSWIPSGISCGIYYLISNYGLENKLFRTPKFEIYEKNYMIKCLTTKQLTQEQYDLYLENGNTGILFTN